MTDHAIILLVEDLESDIIIIRKAFAKARIPNPVHVVRNGEGAISYLLGEGDYSNRAEHPLPDLMLLDLKMPRIDGFEVLQWVRAQPSLKSIPILVLTSSTDMADVNRAYELGANSFLVKPADFDNYVGTGQVLQKYWLKTVQTPDSSRRPSFDKKPAQKPGNS